MWSSNYAVLFILLILGWPALLWEWNPWISVGIIPVNIALFVLVWRSCATSEYSFWNGLEVICAALCSGCANFTIIYLPWVLLIIYVRLAVLAIIGAAWRSKLAAEHWESLVRYFYDVSFRAEQEQRQQIIACPFCHLQYQLLPEDNALQTTYACYHCSKEFTAAGKVQTTILCPGCQAPYALELEAQRKVRQHQCSECHAMFTAAGKLRASLH